MQDYYHLLFMCKRFKINAWLSPGAENGLLGERLFGLPF